MIKKTIFRATFLIVVFGVATLVSAQSAGDDKSTSTKEIQISDLGINNPGILPSSPFYFIKEWERGFALFFTKDPVKKAGLELDYLNERAAEIKKMEEVSPQRTEAIKNALERYKEKTNELKAKFEELKSTSNNPNIDKLIQKFTERSQKHEELFNQLSQKFGDDEDLKNKIDEVGDDLKEITGEKNNLKNNGDNERQSEKNSSSTATVTATSTATSTIKRDENKEDDSRKGSGGDRENKIFCIEVYSPVCGSDGKTYSNSCFAGAAGIKSYTEGVCPSSR